MTNYKKDNMKYIKSGFKLSATALAVSTMLVAGSVHAQETSEEEANAQEAGKLETIEVTARRTVESLQEVPVAVTSVSAADLRDRGITVLTEVQQFSPNTTLQTSRGTNSTLTAFIRGVGQQDPLWGYEPGVGIYIDDVYIARPQGAVLDLLNVQRVEVLRGPQGTLYGKNTIGGAVKYVTKEMSGDAQFNAQTTIGSYSQSDLMITGQMPLIEDKLYVGGGYANLNRDGFGEYLLSALPDQDNQNYNKDLWAARLAVEFRPTNDLFFRLDWDKTEDSSNSKGGYRLLPSILTDAPVPDSIYDSYTSLPTENLVELEGISFLARYDVSDNLQVKYIASSRESYSPTNIDFDNTPVDVFDVPAIYEDENSTHELQGVYTADTFSVTGGLYYYDGESCGSFDAILGALGRIAFGTPGLTREVTGCNNSESIAAYTQADISINDQLSVTVGARYTEETKEAFVNNGLIFANVYPETNWIPGYVRPAGTFPGNNLVPQVLGQDTNNDGVLDAPSEETWSRFTPRLGVDYQVSDDMMVFASYSQGFKSGTFNPRATINEPAADPEVVDSFEVGVKADLSDNLRTNVTLFSLDHKDRQYISVLPVTSPEDLNQILGNVGQSSANGLEAEITWVATDDLTFDFALGYIDADFEEVLTIVDGVETDISDTFAISNTPEYTANVSANYVIDTDLGYFAFVANYYYRDDYNIDETAQSLLSQDGYGLFNVSANWESMAGNWYGGLHLKNLTDEEYLVGGYQFVTPDGSGGFIPGTGGDNTLIGYYGDPRTVQLTIGYRF